VLGDPLLYTSNFQLRRIWPRNVEYPRLPSKSDGALCHRHARANRDANLSAKSSTFQPRLWVLLSGEKTEVAQVNAAITRSREESALIATMPYVFTGPTSNRIERMGGKKGGKEKSLN